MSVPYSETATGLTPQVPIPAGHEFWVTTDKQYAEACTAEYMYLDYVRLP